MRVSLTEHMYYPTYQGIVSTDAYPSSQYNQDATTYLRRLQHQISRIIDHGAIRACAELTHLVAQRSSPEALD